LLLYGSAAPRRLHSFPTRRSSDLPGPVPGQRGEGVGAVGLGGPHRVVAERFGRADRRGRVVRPGAPVAQGQADPHVRRHGGSPRYTGLPRILERVSVRWKGRSAPASAAVAASRAAAVTAAEAAVATAAEQAAPPGAAVTAAVEQA